MGPAVLILIAPPGSRAEGFCTGRGGGASQASPWLLLKEMRPLSKRVTLRTWLIRLVPVFGSVWHYQRKKNNLYLELRYP